MRSAEDLFDTLSTGAEDAPKHESRLHVCDHCGYYAQPEEYSIFYFIFLLVFFAWSSKRVRMCHACVRPEVWKMLAGNLLFVIALPAAVVQLVRAYYGGPTRSREFAELDRGNVLAKKGRAAEAANAYEAICQRVPAAAGVRYNHGLALVRAGQIMEAAEQFEAALGDCANYEPGYTMLAHCYQRLRDVDRLHALQQSWRIHPPPATDTPAATDLAADAYGRAAA